MLLASRAVCMQTIASDARVAVQNDEAGEQYPWRGASTSGQALLG